MYKYWVVQSRWLRDSSQNGERLIAQYTRKKLARGETRATFHSNLEVISKHWMYDVEDFDIDEENLSITLSDEKSVWFHSRFFVIKLWYRRG